MSSAALITSTPVTSPTNSTTYLRNSPRFMARPMVARPGGAGQAPCKVSFDYLVGLYEHRLGQAEAKLAGGTPVQDQLEHRWLLDWKISRPGAPQHLV